MDNQGKNEEDLNVPLDSNSEQLNIKMEDIPAELFAPIGNHHVSKPNTSGPLDQPLNVDDVKETLEEEAKSVQKYQLREKEYNPKTKKTLFFVVGILIVLCCAFVFIFNSSKVVFSRGLSKGYQLLLKKTEEITSADLFTIANKKVISNELGISVQNTIEHSYNNKSIREALDTLKDFSLQAESHVNRSNRQVSAQLKVTSGIYNAVDLTLEGNNDQVIVQLADTHPNPFSFTTKGYSTLFNNDNKTSDLWEDFVKKSKNHFQNFVNEKTITTKKEKITIGETEKTYKKFTYSFSNEEINTFIQSVLTDQSSLTLIEELGISTTKWNEWKNKIQLSENINLSIYTKGIWNQTIGYEIQLDDADQTTVQIIQDKNENKILLQNKNKKLYGYEQSKDKYYLYWDSFTVNAQLKDINADQQVYEYTLYKDKKELFNGNMTWSKTSGNNRKDGLITVDMSLKEEKETVVTSKLEISYSTSVSDYLSVGELKNAVAYQTLSLAEQEKIKNRFVNNEFFLDLEQKIKDISKMEVTDRNTTRYAYSTIDIINRLLKSDKEKDATFQIDGTYMLNQQGLVDNQVVIFYLDNERMLLYPDTTSVRNEVTIKNNVVTSAKLKYGEIYATYDITNTQNPIFLSKNAFL